MTAEILSGPAKTVDDNSPYVGYTKIAKRLSALEPSRPRPYSRQLVERWYKNRDVNDFPLPHPVRGDDGEITYFFHWEEVLAWHIRYRSTHRTRVRSVKPRPRLAEPEPQHGHATDEIDTIPLF